MLKSWRLWIFNVAFLANYLFFYDLVLAMEEKPQEPLQHTQSLTFQNDLKDWVMISGRTGQEVITQSLTTIITARTNEYFNSLKLGFEAIYDERVEKPKRETNTALANAKHNQRIPYLYSDLLGVFLNCTPMDPRDLLALYCTSKLFQGAFSCVEHLMFDLKKCPGDKIYTHKFNRMCPQLKEITFKGYALERGGFFHRLGQINSKSPYKSLLNFVNHAPNLERVAITSCAFNEKSFGAFMDSVGRNPNLKELKLTNISGGDFMNFLPVLTISQLTDIQVSRSILGNFLDEVIDLASQHMGRDVALHLFLDAFLDGASKIPCEQLQKLSECKIQRVSFKNCNIDDFFFHIIMCTFTQYTKVISLDFSYNGITKDYKDHILKALQTFADLKTLNLKGNPIEMEQIEKWRKAVPHMEILF